ncbi:MAG: hypothetical protein HZY75_09385 [Nocardioidaceae bacterium]|nr:MAG: hypothetical protein HZY75_09385 [Nocardioidaceae bacterium]
MTCVYFRDPQERPAAAILPARTPITGTVFVDTDQDGIRDPGENAPTASVSLRFLRPDEYPETLTPTSSTGPRALSLSARTALSTSARFPKAATCSRLPLASGVSLRQHR